MTANRWVILGVLFVVRFSLGYQFQAAGSVGPLLVRDLGIAWADLGMLVGAFMLPGLVVSVPGGFLGQRFGDKRVVLVGIALMAGGGVVSGLSTSFAPLVAGRIVSGVGAAFLFVLVNKMITDWFSGPDLFLGMSVFIVGWPVGIAAGQATQTFIGDRTSWQTVFLCTALLLTVAFVGMATLYRAPPEAVIATKDRRSRPDGREIWLVCIAGAVWMLINGAYLVLLTFGPLLLAERGASAVRAATIVSAMSWVFLVGLPCGGWLAGHFKAPNVIMLGGVLVATSMAAMLPVIDHPATLFVLLGFAYAVAAPVVASLIAEALRPETRAPGLGLYYLWYYAGCATLPAAAGALKDRFGTESAVWFAAAQLVGTLLLIGVFRAEQRRLAVPS
jgi:predicted MFS family arabinose efflux permease